MGFIDERAQFVEAEGGHLLSVWTAAVISIDLDPIRARAGLFANSFEEFGNSTRFLRAPGQHHVFSVAVWSRAIAGRSHNCFGHDEQPRPGNETFFDGALHCDI